MGCKAFTPHLVGLAKELEGEPFHFVASHNQGGSPGAAVHEIFANGLSPFAPNVTVTKHANHPEVSGTGYVPYYLVFDHHGDLNYHHMGGPYHGGDGTAVLDRVRAMLKDVPAIYVGKEPFTAHSEIAADLRSGRNVRQALTSLAAELKARGDDEELARLDAFVQLHRDRVLAKVNAALATDPKAAKKSLGEAALQFAGTPWASPVDDLMAALEDRETFAAHEAAAKDLAWAVERFEELQPVRGNSGKRLNPLDAAFRQKNAKDIAKIAAKLAEVREAYGALPAGERADLMLRLLGR